MRFSIADCLHAGILVFLQNEFISKTILKWNEFLIGRLYKFSLWFYFWSAHPPHYTSSHTNFLDLSHNLVFAFFFVSFEANLLCLATLATFNHECLFLLSTFVFRLWIFIKCNLYIYTVISSRLLHLDLSNTPPYHITFSSSAIIYISFLGFAPCQIHFIRIFNLIKW